MGTKTNPFALIVRQKLPATGMGPNFLKNKIACADQYSWVEKLSRKKKGGPVHGGQRSHGSVTEKGDPRGLSATLSLGTRWGSRKGRLSVLIAYLYVIIEVTCKSEGCVPIGFFPFCIRIQTTPG